MRIKLLIIFLLLANTAYAEQRIEVSAQEGWKEVRFDEPVNRIISITGGWTVDYQNYSPVGPYGHYGSAAVGLTKWKKYKYDRRFPFGALLVDVNDTGTMHISGPITFEDPVFFIRLRINDKDSSFGDNRGSLIVIVE